MNCRIEFMVGKEAAVWKGGPSEYNHALYKEHFEIYKKENRDKILEIGRKYYHKNKDTILKKMKEAKNKDLKHYKEIKRRASKKYAEKNREKIRAYQRKWYAANLEENRKKGREKYYRKRDKNMLKMKTEKGQWE